MAGELHVYFHSTAGTTANTIEDINTKESSQKQQVKKATSTNESQNQNSVDASLIKNLVIDNAMKIAMNGLSIYGDLTGNYRSQAQLQDAIGMVGTAVQLMNWPVGTIATAVNFANKGINYLVDRNNQRQQAELLIQRSGNAVNDDKGTKE